MTPSSSNEELIVLKKRARRRLVGAVALVLIALVVLWNVLDGEPKSASQQVGAQGVEIISDAPGLRGSTNPDAAVTPSVASEASHGGSTQLIDQSPKPLPPAGLPSRPVVDAPTAVAPAVPVEKPVAPAPTPAAVKESHTAESKPAKPEHKPAPKPEQAKPVPKPEQTRPVARPAKAVPANPEPKAVESNVADKPSAASKSQGSFLIQVAALSDESKAKALQGKLAAGGVKAYTETHGELTRVRAGPYASRQAAEDALSRVQGLGLSGVIVPK